MEHYGWKEYCASPIKSVVDHLIRGPLDNLLSLCKDQCLLTEIVIFRKNLAKISSRLRSSKISSLLMKVNRLIQSYLSFNVPALLESECCVFLGDKVGQHNPINLPKGENVLHVLLELRKLADILDNICKYSSYAVTHCILWLRLGHMIPHFIVCLSTISRLNIICRAILVYISDLCNGLIQYCHHSKGSADIINKLAIKSGPLKELCSFDVNQHHEIDNLTALESEKDFGEIVDRDSLTRLQRPESSVNLTEALRNQEDIIQSSKNGNRIIELSQRIKSRRIDVKDTLSRLKKYSSMSVLKKLQKRKKLSRVRMTLLSLKSQV